MPFDCMSTKCLWFCHAIEWGELLALINEINDFNVLSIFL